MTDEVAVVLDASALRAYVHGEVAVGELIAEVAEERRLVAVPAACLAAAHVGVDEVGAALLVLLATAPTVRVLPLGGDGSSVAEEARQVGVLARAAAGDVAVGHAARVAIACRAHYATAEPKVAAAVLPAGWSVLDVGAA
ncbi:hypothetical protein AB0J86_08580 [Micromonospora sp. NPDC049559]|uniref:hypothetical protein n=1 Tax=Micromonospora sp. NPDC049559 TaxID=3155923 RepID=UPI003445B1E7